MATVVTSTSALATAYPHQRREARFNSKDVLFQLSYSGTNLVGRYSTDKAQTWATPTTGATVLTNGPSGSVFIDEDDYIHVAASNGTVVQYVRGTPDTNRTGYTWSTVQTLDTDVNSAHPDLVAHREGTGWVVHVRWSNVVAATPAAKVMKRDIIIANDGTMTLSSLTSHIETYAHTTHTMPSIFVDANKNLHVTWQAGGTSAAEGIRYLKETYNAGSWSSGLSETVTTTVFADQMGPCVVDSQGRVVVTFRAVSPQNIMVFRRTAGTWSDISPASQQGQNPTLTVDPQDNPYVIFVSAGGVFYRKYSGSSWSAGTVIDSDATANYPSARRHTTGGALDAVYTTGTSPTNTVKSYHLALNQSPTAPTSLTPTGSAGINAALVNTFSFRGNDADATDTVSAYQLAILNASTGATVFDSGKVTLTTPPVQGALITVTLQPGAGTSANTTLYLNGAVVNGTNYQWKVLTYDNSGAVSPYSPLASFVARATPSVTITSPASGGSVGVANLQVTWAYAQSGSGGGYDGQKSFRHQLYDSTVVTLLADSGVVTDAAAATYNFSAATGYNLANATSYSIKTTVTSQSGLSASTTSAFTVSYTPSPAPVVTPSANNVGGFIGVTWTTPAPTGSQPVVSYVDLYRRVGSGAFVRVATQLPASGTYPDYAVASGVLYGYKTTTVGTNATTSDSNVVSATMVFAGGGLYLHDPLDPVRTSHFFQYREVNLSDTPKLVSGDFRFVGRTYPVTRFDAKAKTRDVKVRVAVINGTTDRDALEAFLDSRTTLCLRDFRGRLVWGVLKDLPSNDELWGGWVELTFSAVDYSEVR